MPTREECLALALTYKEHPTEAVAGQVQLLCWHCCHPFSGVGTVLPVSWDSRRNAWKTVGTFCSWGCAKAFNSDNVHSHRNGERGMLLTLLKKHTTGRLEGIVPAPPRCCLLAFGGTMGIEEFRSKSASAVIVAQLPERMVPLEQVIHERKVQEKREAVAPGPDMEQNVNLTASTQKNETLRLKRPRPMPSSSDVLARTMGLEFFK